MHTVDQPPPSRQRGPHNDATLLDGDSGHGSSDIVAGDEWAVDTDTDVVDEVPTDVFDDADDSSLPAADVGEADETAAEAMPDEAAPSDEADADEVDEADEEAADEDDSEETVDEPDAEAADDADLETAAAGEGTALEAEVDRQMDRTSTPADDAPTNTARPPLDGYDSLTVPQVLERMRGLDAARVVEVLSYEQANRNRKTLVAKLTRLAR